MNDLWEKTKIIMGLEPIEDDTSINEKQKKQSIKTTNTSLNLAKKKWTSSIMVFEPKIYEESMDIAQYLREDYPVIVNLKGLDSHVSKRIIDFICGTTYALNGNMQKIADHIFLFTPEQTKIISQPEHTADKPLSSENTEFPLFQPTTPNR